MFSRVIYNKDTSKSDQDIVLTFPGEKTSVVKIFGEIQLELKTHVSKLLEGISIKVDGIESTDSQGRVLPYTTEIKLHTLFSERRKPGKDGDFTIWEIVGVAASFALLILIAFRLTKCIIKVKKQDNGMPRIEEEFISMQNDSTRQVSKMNVDDLDDYVEPKRKFQKRLVGSVLSTGIR